MKVLVIFLTILICGLILFGGCYIGYRIESKGWNGGICPKCGHKLEYFDTDSQGGEGWTCRELTRA